MKTRTAFILSLTAILTLAAGSAFGKYSGGTGEPNDPYQIADANDLLLLAADANDYGKSFILTADINMEGQVFTTAIIAAGGSIVFTGTFDGNDHKIRNFTINGGSNSYLGLFGRVNTGGSVKNLGLEDCSVNGSLDSWYIGGLVGGNSYGSISNCYSTGSVSGYQYFGGLVGYNYSGNIINCYSIGTVSGSSYSERAGGLVGKNTGDIISCYSIGAVSSPYYVGGLVGYHSYGNIINCYSTGTISGSGYVGGLVGDNYEGDITNCYSTGNVSGSSSFVGGLVGYLSGGNIGNCYSTCDINSPYYVGGLVGSGFGNVTYSFWDTQTSGRTTSEGGTGKTTAEMKTLSTFTSAGWDFVDVWGIGNGQTYPYLKQFNGINPADLNYSGTVDFADFAILAANWLSDE
jgi:hypothetical protein